MDQREKPARPADRAQPPPRGWQVPEPPSQGPTGGELAEIVALVERSASLLAEVSRGLVPTELRGQFSDALRELLLALRALVDWYLERLDRPAEQPVEVEEIPIS